MNKLMKVAASGWKFDFYMIDTFICTQPKFIPNMEIDSEFKFQINFNSSES